MKKIVSILLAVGLAVGLLCLTGCGDEDATTLPSGSSAPSSSSTTPSSSQSPTKTSESSTEDKSAKESESSKNGSTVSDPSASLPSASREQ